MSFNKTSNISGSVWCIKSHTDGLEYESYSIQYEPYKYDCNVAIALMNLIFFHIKKLIRFTLDRSHIKYPGALDFGTRLKSKILSEILCPTLPRSYLIGIPSLENRKVHQNTFATRNPQIGPAPTKIIKSQTNSDQAVR